MDLIIFKTHTQVSHGKTVTHGIEEKSVYLMQWICVMQMFTVFKMYNVH